ncbi:helix-turn-helix domain-containing protein [Hyphococcus flavus]|jgi:Cu(I)-responsive transcriptional regulator|uniref:Helix-turn-helix domain-containing protein n=1 Tax=Hyphococcus flavus TaxID=1866326 RepID=A0AAE9ZCI1_9PROT|nr:helix-turn-helix domain-containing protein [Hyphococcus flavus]WDI31951.1 helix-turn-helix domain-containing protein [Hyphococcus flavus]
MPKSEKSPVTIGRLAKASDVKVTTIRYYESIGLIDPPDRSEGGQRIYDAKAIERMRFIRHARDLGFPLEAIRELIALSRNENRSCADVDEIARRHAEDVRQRIKRLKSLERELNRMIKECSVDKISDCRVIEILSNHALCATEHRN